MLDTIRVYKGYTPEFKADVARMVEELGTGKACELSGVSPFTALAWHKKAGYTTRRVGAPEGNMNALGGRITNLTRHVPSATRLHRTAAGRFSPLPGY